MDPGDLILANYSVKFSYSGSIITKQIMFILEAGDNSNMLIITHTERTNNIGGYCTRTDATNIHTMFEKMSVVRCRAGKTWRK